MDAPSSLTSKTRVYLHLICQINYITLYTDTCIFINELRFPQNRANSSDLPSFHFSFGMS